MKKLPILFTFVFLSLAAGAQADDDFKFTGNIMILGGTLTSASPTEIYINSGCGAENQKCSCTWDASSETLTMQGTGTSGTSTGLDFTCNWQVQTTNGSCLVKWRVDIPHSGDNGMNLVLSSGCSVVSVLKPQISCSGHNFTTNTGVQMNGQQSGGTPGQIDKGSCN